MLKKQGMQDVISNDLRKVKSSNALKIQNTVHSLVSKFLMVT